MNRFTAKRRPVQTGVAGWNAILGPQTTHPTLDQDITADFVVVGAGFAGLSAARRLKQLQPTARIVVLEAGLVAEGAAGRNSGFMIDLSHNLPGADQTAARGEAELIQLNRQAQDFASTAVQDYGIDSNYFDRAGKINGAVDQKTLSAIEQEKAHLDRIGETSEMLDAQSMAEITGGTYYSAGLFTPGTVTLQPAGYIHGLAQGLTRDGINLYEKTPLTSFACESTGWRASTPAGTVSTPKLILSVNGHLESFGFARGRLMQLFLFGAMTPELDADQIKTIGGHSRWGITPIDPMGATVRRIDTGQGGNRLLIRTGAVLRSNMNASITDLLRAQHWILNGFDARFPMLAGLQMEHVWAGHLCLSKNGVAVMREIEKGVYSACVQNGLGTARGTLTGIGAAELACGETSAITRRFTSEPDPTPLPPQPFRDVGANALLGWNLWKARRA